MDEAAQASATAGDGQASSRCHVVEAGAGCWRAACLPGAGDWGAGLPSVGGHVETAQVARAGTGRGGDS